MFTGIVTDVGEITALTPGGRRGDRRFVIADRGTTSAPIAIGASIACSGCCLTVVEKGADWFAVEASGETLRQDPSRRLAAGPAGQPRAVAASSATSWAATSSTAMSTASARSCR